MPLGNLTSQFLANVYLNELDQFVKPKLKAKYYIRYVDDFVILNSSKQQLNTWKNEINDFLKKELKIELHSDKSRIIPLSRAIPFVGFKVFYHYKLLKKLNRKSIQKRLNSFHNLFREDKIDYDKIYESLQGSFAYMCHANTQKLKKSIVKQIEAKFPNRIASIEINRYLKHLKLTDNAKKIRGKSSKLLKGK